MKIAIIIFGPQGSGKGTQADLLAKKFNLFHFDTGQYIRNLLYDPANKNDKIIQRERKIVEAGVLATPSWVLKIVSEAVKKSAAMKQGIVFSGSPRTFYEGFGHGDGQQKGDKRQEGLIKTLKKHYGKENISVFIFNLPLKDSLKRINGRLVCSICHGPLLIQKIKLTSCPFCGGKIIKRKDDMEKSIKERLTEYQKRTTPIFAELKKQSYRIIEIDACPAPYKIFETICRKLKQF